MRAVAHYTCKEFLRKKVIYIILFIALLLILGSVLAGQLALSEKVKVMQDIAFGVIEICWLIVVLFFWSHLLSVEIEQGTIFMLLSKNIKRANVILGKYLWFTVILLFLWLALCGAFALLLAVYQMPRLEMYRYVLPAIFLGWLLTFAIVLFFSTFVSPFVALFTALIVYTLGHMLSFVVYYVTEFKAVAFSSVFVYMVKGLYLLWPNYTSLSLYEFINVPGATQIVWSQFVSSGLISLVHVLLLLTLATLIFRKKQL